MILLLHICKLRGFPNLHVMCLFIWKSLWYKGNKARAPLWSCVQDMTIHVSAITTVVFPFSIIKKKSSIIHPFKCPSLTIFLFSQRSMLRQWWIWIHEQTMITKMAWRSFLLKKLHGQIHNNLWSNKLYGNIIKDVTGEGYEV